MRAVSLLNAVARGGGSTGLRVAAISALAGYTGRLNGREGLCKGADVLLLESIALDRMADQELRRAAVRALGVALAGSLEVRFETLHLLAEERCPLRSRCTVLREEWLDCAGPAECNSGVKFDALYVLGDALRRGHGLDWRRILAVARDRRNSFAVLETAFWMLSALAHQEEAVIPAVERLATAPTPYGIQIHAWRLLREWRHD